MKTQTSFLVALNKNEMNHLTREVKETVAVNYAEHKNFSAADFWNIQKMRKATRTSRRMFI